MKIYTSYFANGKKLHDARILMIGIALYPPKWYQGVSVRMVSPTNSILHEADHERYTERFKKEVLSKVDPKWFYNQLMMLGRGKDVALCCFEKPEDFCHRHIVAEWLIDNLNIEVEEFGYKPSKEPKYVQGSLF